MDTINWNTFLSLSKFIFIGLIYLVLFFTLLLVQREMRLHIDTAKPTSRGVSGQLKLIQTHPGSPLRLGHVFPLQNRVLLGADEANDIVLNDNFISGKHACLRWDGARWWIEDLGSTNGTFIGQRRCPPHQEQPIPVGATLRLGNFIFELLG